jgi:hypothetical protein
LSSFIAAYSFCCRRRRALFPSGEIDDARATVVVVPERERRREEALRRVHQSCRRREHSHDDVFVLCGYNGDYFLLLSSSFLTRFLQSRLWKTEGGGGLLNVLARVSLLRRLLLDKGKE